jgi:hypothetical protein
MHTRRAAEYLRRVAALTGAKRVRSDSYWLRAGHRNFLVDYKFVRLISRHGKSTGISVAADPDMPSEEVVGSALLHLKNNPRLFEKWRELARRLLAHVFRPGSFNREANPNDDTRSSRPRSSGDHVLELGFGIAAGCLSKQSPSVGAFGIAANWKAHRQPQEDESAKLKHLKVIC